MTRTKQQLSIFKIFFIIALSSANAWGMGKKAPTNNAPSKPTPSKPSAPSSGSGNASDPDFDYVDPDGVVPSIPLNQALAYYKSKKSSLGNPNFLTVIDFSQKSTSKRFYMIDMRTGEVERFLTAHGKGSDSNHDGYATVFSNTSGSNASSLGFYHTAETYYGGNGYSLRLDGKSSTNSNARSRAIVIHGASYVDPDWNPIGRSLGCPALENGVRTRVINLLQGGSVIYAYHKNFM